MSLPANGHMLAAANNSHVHVLRNAQPPRTLLGDMEEGDEVPRGLFLIQPLFIKYRVLNWEIPPSVGMPIVVT